MVEENERISYDPWLAWHKITGERVSGPSPLPFRAAKNTTSDDQNGSDVSAKKPPQRFYRHSRPKFHKMLTEQCHKVGIDVEYGKYVVEYYEKPNINEAGVLLKSGEVVKADVVVAADGIGSKSTKITLDTEVAVRPTGYAIFRTAFPVQMAISDPLIRERFTLMPDGRPIAEMWMG
jgi:2-polyprenyl-6-methoxyphenol hydroxylase-like FAD-dependent oxidoreductase